MTRPDRVPALEPRLATPPQHYLRRLTQVAVMVGLGLAAGLASARLEWKIVVGVALGLVVTAAALVQPVAGCVFLVVALPLLGLFPPDFAGVKAVNPLNLMLMVAVVSWIGNCVLTRMPVFRRSALNLPLLSFIALLIGSLVVTVHNVPADHMDSVLDNLKACVTCFLLFFIVAGVLRTDRSRRAVMDTVFIMVIFSASRGLMEYMLDLAKGASADRIRLGGFLGQANEFGGFLAMYAPVILVHGVADPRKRWRTFYFAGAAATILALLFTQSRGGIIGLGIALVVLGLFRERRLLAVLLAAALLAPIWLPSSVTQRFSGTKVVDQAGEERLDDSSLARLEVWEGGLQLYRESPVFGHGFGSFYYALLGSGYEGKVLAPHSTYIRTVAENGTVGLAALLWLLGTCLWVTARRGRGWRPGAEDLLRSGMFGSVLAVFAVNIFGTRFYNIQEAGYFWILLGVLASYGWRDTRAHSAPATPAAADA